MQNRILFCNVGWMREYKGQNADDKIIGGGKYVRTQKRGNEVCSFVPVGKKYLGYVQPVGARIKLERLGGLAEADCLSGVDVVLLAKQPGGTTVIVGWYKDATVYRDRQPIRHPSSLHKTNNVRTYQFEALVENSNLLPWNKRGFHVPRGKGWLGNSNVWYAEQVPPAWLQQVHNLLAGKEVPSGKGKARATPNTTHNTQVELAAINCAWNWFWDNGYELKDVSKENWGWDLQAISNAHTLQIEVKGLSGSTPTIELTPNEYRAFSKCSPTYRLFIVTHALSKPLPHICTYNPANQRWEVELNGTSHFLNIKERVSASITVA